MSPASIIAGTMRLHEHSRTADEWASFFADAWDLGLRKLHVSDEYDSWPVFLGASAALERYRPDVSFDYIVKLGEPHFDEAAFSASRLSSRIDEYRTALRRDRIASVQWMWRSGLAADPARVAAFRDSLPAIADASTAEKQAGRIGGFLCFPYSLHFALEAAAAEALDGLVVYRNAKEQEMDEAIRAAHDAGKPSIVIRPFAAGAALAGGGTAAGHFREALNLPGIEGAIVSLSKLSRVRELLDA